MSGKNELLTLISNLFEKLDKEKQERAKGEKQFWEDAEKEGLLQYRHVDQNYNNHLYEGIWQGDLFWTKHDGITVFIPRWLMDREMVSVE